MFTGELALPGSNNTIVSQHREGFWLVSFPEELARARPSEVRNIGDSILQKLSESNPNHCLVDLSPLPTLGSSLVASIVRIWKAISQHDGQMVVVAPSPEQREVLRVTGLNNVWTVAPTMEAGIHHLGFSKEAKVVKRERRLLVLVSTFSLLNAAAAVIIRILPQLEGYKQPNNTLVFAILGLTVLTSTICLFRERGWRLWLAVVVFLTSLALSGGFIWHTQYRKPNWIVPESEMGGGQEMDRENQETDNETEGSITSFESVPPSQPPPRQPTRLPPLFGTPRERNKPSPETETTQPPQPSDLAPSDSPADLQPPTLPSEDVPTEGTGDKINTEISGIQ